MTSARDIMTKQIEYLKTDETVAEAAKRFAQSGIGAAPVCEPSGHLYGVVTDRDIVTKVIAENRDPQTTRLEELAEQPEVVTIGADDSIEEALQVMKQHKVRRLPVIDGTEVVGMISQGDLARSLPNEKAGDLISVISSE